MLENDATAVDATSMSTLLIRRFSDYSRRATLTEEGRGSGDGLGRNAQEMCIVDAQDLALTF